MDQNQYIKVISAVLLSLLITACSNPMQDNIEPILEVYPTNMNDCAPVIDNEDYINIDCKRRSVNRLTDEVHYNDEPALVSMQGYSFMESSLRKCENLTTEDITALEKVLEDTFQNVIVVNYDFDKHPEFKKEFDLIREKLKGKYDHLIKKEDCESFKKMAHEAMTEKYKLK